MANSQKIYLNSSGLVEFFFFLLSFFMLIFCMIKIFFLHDDFHFSEKPTSKYNYPPNSKGSKQDIAAKDLNLGIQEKDKSAEKERKKEGSERNVEELNLEEEKKDIDLEDIEVGDKKEKSDKDISNDEKKSESNKDKDKEKSEKSVMSAEKKDEKPGSNTSTSNTQQRNYSPVIHI